MMTQAEEALFVGGCNDGKRILLSASPVRLPIHDGPYVKHEVYYRRHFMGQVLYALSGLSQDDVARMLVEAYGDQRAKCEVRNGQVEIVFSGFTARQLADGGCCECRGSGIKLDGSVCSCTMFNAARAKGVVQ